MSEWQMAQYMMSISTSFGRRARRGISSGPKGPSARWLPYARTRHGPFPAGEDGSCACACPGITARDAAAASPAPARSARLRVGLAGASV
ncbi:hypothetical protein [Pantoea coffeiphila]|uniref:hypothetical protein n=1 Tax=Pantoea coffeiphila TaxID=1465635 RepID=UPI001FD2DC51|nr:hypothetical protein [Pantoea coffeiphila]